MKFTVLLLYPDFLDEERVQTYMTHVEADSVAEAQTKAQRELTSLYDDDDSDLLDYEVLLVIAGEHQDIKE